MKITICNSIHFHAEAKQTKEILEQQGHEALTHPMELEFRGKMLPVIEYYKARKTGWDDEIEQLKHDAMKEHFDKIKNSEAILVLNYNKDGKENYIGGNTFMEMSAAFLLNKKIFMLNPISEELSYAEEIKGMKPTVLNGDLKNIKMKITICGSLKFSHEFKKIKEELEKLGHEVLIPFGSTRIITGISSVEEVEKAKQDGEFSKRVIEHDALKRHCNKIKESDAVLIANFDKNNIKNYIGGATLMELGYAHIFNKKIFLLNPIPEISYIDEIESVQPVIINGDLTKIK